MDAGGAIVHRATREAAGCGRLPRHPAARRAAKTKPYQHPERPKVAGRMPASTAYPASLCEPQDAASMHKLNTASVQSARRRKHVRTTGAGHGGPAPSSIARIRRASPPPHSHSIVDGGFEEMS